MLGTFLTSDGLGGALAGVLAGSWRVTPARASISLEQLGDIAVALNKSGAGALAWQRARLSPALAGSDRAAYLQDAARDQGIREILNQDILTGIVTELAAAGVTPLVFKGWAAAQYYSQTYLRPMGDIDLIVRPDELSSTRAVLAKLSPTRSPETQSAFHVIAPGRGACAIDLHAQLAPYYVCPVDALFGRAIPLTTLQGAPLLAPCHEDHLRLVSLHLLNHGAWRPLWLCDVAAMVEAIGPDFDWDRCLTDNETTRRWILAVIAAAIELLGARPGQLPAHIAPWAPPWVTDAIVEEWGQQRWARMLRNLPALASHDPLGWLETRWPNPILAAFASGHPPSAGVQLLRQLGYVFGKVIPTALSSLATRAWWKTTAARWRRTTRALFLRRIAQS